MTINELASHLQNVRWHGNTSFQCSCPVHTDNTPSLTVSLKNGKILLHCHAGCETSDILSAVGLRFDDITGTERKTYTWHDRLGYGISQNAGCECKFVAEYRYTDENGNYLYSKVRYEGGGKKEIRYIIVDEQKDEYRYPQNEFKHTLYHLPELVKAIQQGRTIYYVEGEKDVETLTKHGLVAVTAGGVTDWNSEYARYFTGAKVVFLEDNDEPGRKHRKQVIRDIVNYAFWVKWTTTSEREHGDVTDYIEEGHSIEDVKQLVESAAQNGNIRYPSWVYIAENSGKIQINEGLLADCIQRTNHYIRLRNPTSDKESLYVYRGGVYELYNDNMLRGLIGSYIPAAYRKASTLRNVSNLIMANNANAASMSDINSNEKYINFENGIYDIDKRKLIPHTPDIIYTCRLNAKYEADKKDMPAFEKFINDFCTNEGVVDESKKALLQEWMGLCLSNIPAHRLKKCLILHSTLGNTGKSQYLGLIKEIIGVDNVSSVAMQDFSERFNTSFMFGKRANIVGDQQYTDIGTSSIFKALTGGDTVSCEMKGRGAFSFVYNGVLLFACNELPAFTDDKGGHLFERFCIVPCSNYIPKEKRDMQLLPRMIKEKSAIVNWALEGLERLIKNGFQFTECEASENVLNEYRSKIDTMHAFLLENYICTGDRNERILKNQFEADYEKWCVVQGTTPIKKRNIKERMAANGIISKKTLGNNYYIGLKSRNEGII